MLLLEMNLLLIALLLLWPFLSRRITPGARYFIAIIVLIGFLLPIRPTLPIQPVSVALPERVRIPQSAVEQNVAPVATSQDTPVHSAETTGDDTAVEPRRIQFGFTQVKHLLLFVWGAGVLLSLAYAAVRHGRLLRFIRRHASPVEDSELLARLNRERQALGIRQSIRARRCQAFHTPFVYGVFRPTLVYTHPDDISAFILRHELCHVKRRDLLIKGIILLSRSLNWYNPLVRRLARIAELECEVSCDAMAIRAASPADRRVYAQALLTIAAANPPHRGLTTEWNGGSNQMKKRMISILEQKKRSRGLLVIACVLLAVLCAGQTLVIGETMTVLDEHLAHTDGAGDPDVLIWGEGGSYGPVYEYVDLSFLHIGYDDIGEVAPYQGGSMKTKPFNWQLDNTQSAMLKPGWDARGMYAFYTFIDTTGKESLIETAFSYVNYYDESDYIAPEDEYASLLPLIEDALSRGELDDVYYDYSLIVDTIEEALGDHAQITNICIYTNANVSSRESGITLSSFPYEAVEIDQVKALEEKHEWAVNQLGCEPIVDERELTWENAEHLIDQLLMTYAGREVAVTFANGARWMMTGDDPLHTYHRKRSDGSSIYLHSSCALLVETGLSPWEIRIRCESALYSVALLYGNLSDDEENTRFLSEASRAILRDGNTKSALRVALMSAFTIGDYNAADEFLSHFSIEIV